MDIVQFRTNYESYKNDFEDIIRAFNPFVKFDENGKLVEILISELENDEIYVNIKIDNNFLATYEKTIKLEKYATKIERNSLIKRHAKIFLYELMAKEFNRDLPYGSLTGIRPTKLFHELNAKGYDSEKYFKNVLHVSDEKIDLIKTICQNQTKIIYKNNKHVDLFVNIPICVSRCSYCSFLAAEIGKIKKLVNPYCECLIREIDDALEIIENEKLTVRSIYVGGGTPTSIDDELFEKILSHLKFVKCNEFTVEAGRPDTITFNKLKIMQDMNVTRISINPQSFNQKTLDLIGRKHSVEDVYAVYEMARKFNFVINMDLIAMLPNENFEDFKYSCDEAIKLKPDNITIHTLALKRGSKLREDNYDNTQAFLPQKMVDYASEQILKNGYEPYYMYKQKYVSGNLENVGYCLKGKECIYNVDIMEETNSIIACGAGAISKRLFLEENLLTRLANPKGLDVYLDRIDSIILNKRNFFLNI